MPKYRGHIRSNVLGGQDSMLGCESCRKSNTPANTSLGREPSCSLSITCISTLRQACRELLLPPAAGLEEGGGRPLAEAGALAHVYLPLWELR